MASTLYQPIMQALLALIEADCGALFKTYSRRLITWPQLQGMLQSPSAQALDQPALFVYDGAGFGGGLETFVQQGRTPAKRTKKVTLVIYAQITGGGTPGGIDSTTPGADIFYPLIEALEDALNPVDSDAFGVVTLGGLVTHCWIEGEGVIIPGDIDPNGQGMATVPVSILIP